MATFHLTSTWTIPASIETCWFSILDVTAWPGWWKYVQKVTEIESGDSSGINTTHQYQWSTCLPYQLIFNLNITSLTPYKLITFDATSGDLIGNGCCKFIQKNNVTSIQFEWHVQTNKPWMTYISTFFQPIFEWNHRRVMQSGEQSLIQRLNLNA